MKLPARGVERVELSTWDVGDWRGSTECDGRRTVSELDRLCGRLELGDMFQSDSSVVELIIRIAKVLLSSRDRVRAVWGRNKNGLEVKVAFGLGALAPFF